MRKSREQSGQTSVSGGGFIWGASRHLVLPNRFTKERNDLHCINRNLPLGGSAPEGFLSSDRSDEEALRRSRRVFPLWSAPINATSGIDPDNVDSDDVVLDDVIVERLMESSPFWTLDNASVIASQIGSTVILDCYVTVDPDNLDTPVKFA